MSQIVDKQGFLDAFEEGSVFWAVHLLGGKPFKVMECQVTEFSDNDDLVRIALPHENVQEQWYNLERFMETHHVYTEHDEALQDLTDAALNVSIRPVTG